MKSIVQNFVYALCLFLLTSSYLANNNNQIEVKKNDAADTIHNYFWANLQQFKGNTQEAGDWYEKIYDNNKYPASIWTYKGFINKLFKQKSYQEIYHLIDKVDEHFKKDANIQLIFVSVLEKMGKQNEADARLIQIHDEFLQNSEIILQTAQVYIRRKEPENALLIIDKMLNNSPRKPNNFIFYFLKAQIYVQRNDLQKALDAAKESIELFPYFDKGWLLIASLQEQIGQLEDAIHGYQKFISLTTIPTQYIEQHLFGLMLKQKMQNNSNTHITMKSTCFEKAILFFNKKEYDAASDQIEYCLEQNPNDDESKLLKIEILTAKEEYLLALAAIKEWIKADPTEQLWIKAIHLIGINNNSKDAINLLAQLEKTYPNNEWISLYYADLLLRDNNIAQAVSKLEHAAKISKDDNRKATIYFQMALIYFHQEAYEKTEIALKKGYESDPTFAPLLNLLAYYWAAIGNENKKALYYIKKALGQEPNNPYFRDTYALILYKQGEYDEAKEILQELTNKNIENSTMHFHLAKVYHKTHNIQKAQEQLALAEKHTNDSREKKNIKKLKSKIVQLIE